MPEISLNNNTEKFFGGKSSRFRYDITIHEKIGFNRMLENIKKSESAHLKSKSITFHNSKSTFDDYTTSMTYYSNKNIKKRYCGTHDIYKYDRTVKNGEKRIITDYTTEGPHGYKVVKEKNSPNGEFVTKIYKKPYYSHPEDSLLHKIVSKLDFTSNQFFLKKLESDKLIYDSTKKYSNKQVNNILAKNKQLPQKGVTILKNLIKIFI